MLTKITQQHPNSLDSVGHLHAFVPLLLNMKGQNHKLIWARILIILIAHTDGTVADFVGTALWCEKCISLVLRSLFLLILFFNGLTFLSLTGVIVSHQKIHGSAGSTKWC